MNKILNIKPLGFPWPTQDPFLFCTYHRDEYPSGNSEMGANIDDLRGRNIGSDFTIKDGWRMYHGKTMPGFPYHPHRGFETITINKEGVVDHSDSLGAAGRFMEGDVQWMTAGRGIQHSEMFPLLHEDKPNTLEIFQIWLNLPSTSKLVDPHFKMLWKEDVPVINHKDEAGKTSVIDIVAGAIDGIKAVTPAPNSWAADPNNYVGVYTIKMEANAIWTLPATDEAANRSLFYYKGNGVVIDGQKINNDSVVEVKSNAEINFENGSQESCFLILQGRPIGEPVVQHGPFVMNTQEEIRETMREYGKTQFGGWPWDKAEIAHHRMKGRFALHGDGVEEVR